MVRLRVLDSDPVLFHIFVICHKGQVIKFVKAKAKTQVPLPPSRHFATSLGELSKPLKCRNFLGEQHSVEAKKTQQFTVTLTKLNNTSKPLKLKGLWNYNITIHS